MRNLSSFMAGAAQKVDNAFYVASDRFVDPETEKPVPWEIKCISSKENSAIRKACMKSIPVQGGRKGQFTQEFDAGLYQAKVAARCTVFPDLDSSDLQDSYGVMGSDNLIMAMLTPGEFEDYSAKVLEVNGFTNQQELVDEAKN